jgi:alcohol dehydrogenase (cytochrome c)
MMKRILLLVVLTASLAQAQVSSDRIGKAAGEPQNWLTYSGNYNGNRYSTLSQITTDNVKNLELQWVLQVQQRGNSDKWEASPLVVDGVMYTVRPPNDVVAVDAVTAAVLGLHAQSRTGCARLLRSRESRTGYSGQYAVHGNDRWATACDRRKNGTLMWNVPVGAPEAGYSVTVAPLVVKDKIIVGPAGGEYGIRGFLAAYSPADGKEMWRFNTIPRPENLEAKRGKAMRGRPAAVPSGRPAHMIRNSISCTGDRQSRAGLERRWTAGRQPLYGLRRRAGSGYRKAEMALSVHPAR